MWLFLCFQFRNVIKCTAMCQRLFSLSGRLCCLKIAMALAGWLAVVPPHHVVLVKRQWHHHRQQPASIVAIISHASETKN